MKCRGCRADIDFIRLPSGKCMPVEGRTAETYYVHHDAPGHPQIVLVLDEGTILRGRLGTREDSGVLRVEGRESHFPRCPASAAMRQSSASSEPA